MQRLFNARSASDQLVNEAKRQLGISQRQNYAYRAAGLHPLYSRGLPHPDDRAALVSLAGGEYRRGLRQKTLEVVPQVEIDLAHAMVLVGSPEAEGVAQLAFGYRRRPDDSGMEYHQPPLELPYRWDEDRWHVEAVCRRFVEGRGLLERPNWPIIDNMKARRLFPRLDNDGLLQTDLLLVTKVPNFLTRTGFESGHSLVTFAGAHGPATRAVSLLLKDRNTLQEVGRHLPPDSAAFQILIEVGDMQHHPVRGTEARALRLRDVRIIDLPEADWVKAHSQVKSNYPAWHNQMIREGHDPS